MALNRTQMVIVTLRTKCRRCITGVMVCSALVLVICAPTASAQQCQPLTPAAPFPIWGVDSAAGCGCGEVGWDSRGMIPWQEFAQGEYVGH
ncbi:MAG TPA: hypothetical protein VFW73_10085, partial [Lacipirellulaceae bacterium]|nr:hypothetical protein [Lacipirellulaceae bacterium]